MDLGVSLEVFQGLGRHTQQHDRVSRGQQAAAGVVGLPWLSWRLRAAAQAPASPAPGSHSSQRQNLSSVEPSVPCTEESKEERNSLGFVGLGQSAPHLGCSSVGI